MNELNKLIQLYETENPGEKAYHSYRMGHIPDRPNPRFMDWMARLASRPTCGKEQRKFLDEIREKGVLFKFIANKNTAIGLGTSIIDQSDFDTNIENLTNKAY